MIAFFIFFILFSGLLNHQRARPSPFKSAAAGLKKRLGAANHFLPYSSILAFILR
jgi:hypothetical protein